MNKDYAAIIASISANTAKLRADIPDTMKGFSAMAHAACSAGALDEKTKELIALALSVGLRCDGCIGFHVRSLAKLKATRAEVEEALGMAIYMGGGPALMYAADALGAYEDMVGR